MGMRSFSLVSRGLRVRFGLRDEDLEFVEGGIFSGVSQSFRFFNHTL